MGNQDWIVQHYLASSPIALTDASATDAELEHIYRGNDASVFRGGIPVDGKLGFFRAGSEDIGEANTNLLKPAAFDWPFDVAGIGFQVSFPRSVVDGADLLDAAGIQPIGASASVAARRFASRMTRMFELFINNSMLFFWIAEDIIAQCPLDWVGSGPMVWTEGLSIFSGEEELYTVGQETISPSVAAFSCRVGFEGKKDLWNLMTPDDAGKKWGARVVEQQGFRLYTMTDPAIVTVINRILFAATGGGPGPMWSDRRIGVRLTASLFGDRTIRSNYGAMGK